jgi:AraC-like DNA-binding protein
MVNQQKNFVLSMLAYAAQKDVSAQQLCKLSDINLDAFLKKENMMLSSKQLQDLWLNASHLSRDTLFGLHFGESLQLAALGIVGEIIKSSSTVGEGITHAAALAHLFTDLFRIEVVLSKQYFTIRFIPLEEEPGIPSQVFQHTMDLFMAFVVHELDGLLLMKVKPHAVRYAYSVTDPAEYERVLRCRPVRKTGEYALVFENTYWDQPILTANYELQHTLLQKVGAIPQELSNAQTYQAKIYNYLLANSYLGIVSLETISANFNVSVRSLQRKLKEEGVKYQEVADEVRKSLAVNYLSSGSYNVKEISHMLGYNELSAFTRAFKRWTGTTPVNYPQQ